MGWFYIRLDFAEIVVDTNRSSNEIIFDFLTTYIQAGNLFRHIYFLSKSEYKKWKITSKKR